MNSASALPGRARRALTTLCAAAALLAFIAPAPAALAEEPSPPVVEVPAEVPTVAVQGNPAVYSTLTAVFPSARPAGTIRYQYLRNGVAVNTPSLFPEHRLWEDEFGARISVRVTATVDGQEPIVLTSPETPPVLGYIWWSPSRYGQPILGTTIGVTISPTGRPAMSTAPQATYTWLRNGQPIAGASQPQYTIIEEDLGAEVSATVQLTAPDYAPSTQSTSFGTAIRGYLNLASVPVITYSSGTPNTAFPGTVMKASAPQVQAPVPAGVTYAYQWGYSSGYSSSWIDLIPGAIAASYTLRTEDIGKDIRVRVTPIASDYVGNPSTSAYGAAPNIRGRFTATAAPRITGTAMAGQLLTAVPGAAPSPIADSVQYVWYQDGWRLTDASTDPTYRLTTADGGHKITVKAFYNKANYVQAASPASAAVAPPGYFSLAATPWMVGTGAVGYTVSARTGGTSPSPTSASYQWFRDGKPIVGATGISYRLTAPDQWRQITFKVTFKRAGIVSATQTSRILRPLAVFTKLPTPVVRGTFAAGQVLRASTALPYPAPTSVTWQWQREGRPIAGATASTYRLTANDRDKFIRVVATFKRANYLSTTRASASRWLPGRTAV
jgi:hypothetical protein